MGTYINPPDKVYDLGKVVMWMSHTPTGEGDYEELMDYINEDEVLFALYQRGDNPFKNAVHIFSAEELEEFEGQHRRGIIKREDFIVIKRSVAEKECGAQLRAQEREKKSEV